MIDLIEIRFHGHRQSDNKEFNSAVRLDRFYLEQCDMRPEFLISSRIDEYLKQFEIENVDIEWIETTTRTTVKELPRDHLRGMGNT